MTGGDQQESLWAGSPAPQEDAAGPVPEAPAPRSGAKHESLWARSRGHEPPGLDDVIVRWEREEPEASAPGADGQPVRRRALAVAAGVIAAIAVVALTAALPGRGFPSVVDVPSYWGDVTMSCRTARFEQGERALELFRCHAVDGGRLPPGVYRTPDARWTSDITRREARASGIEISRDGRLTGWAAY